MKNKQMQYKAWILVVLALMVACPTAEVFANRPHGDRDRGRPHHRFVSRHDHYRYHNGRFYTRGLFGFEFVVVSPPFGAVISTLPFGHRTIYVRGVPYYTYDNVYYIDSPNGYIVVPPPGAVVPVAPVVPVTPVMTVPASGSDNVVVNVPNVNGSYTPITLVKRDKGYVGPQGEYYDGNPTIEQLKVLYGK